ncbi:MAG: hypothetical protein WAK16_05060 [Candidatus Cybelea sp.]
MAAAQVKRLLELALYLRERAAHAVEVEIGSAQLPLHSSVAFPKRGA